MQRKIIQIGNPLLREVSTPVDISQLGSSEIVSLKQDLLDTLRSQAVGVAISAIQIGIPIQFFIVEIKPTPNRTDLKPIGPLYFFNPQILKLSSETISMSEACLSIMKADLFGDVTRPKKVTIEFISDTGEKDIKEYDGFLGRVIQHEMDHLQGKLFTDVVDPFTLSSQEEYRKALSRRKPH